MGPASKFEEFTPGFDKDMFGDGDGPTETDPAPEEESEDEEQLLKDGNDQVLKNFETQRKSQDYSRSQASRDKKAPEISMDFVDWSGFPGAAHTSPAVTGMRKSRSDRLSGTSSHDSGANTDSEKRTISRSHQRKLAAAAGIKLKTGGEEGDSSPPAKEPKKYRNRRHSFKGTLSNSLHGASNPPGSFARRASAGHLSGSTHAEKRQQRRGSGSAKGLRNQKATTQEASSPSGRIRRPVNAAAASTRLEGGRKPPQRNGSNGRRQRSQRTLSGTNGSLKVAGDGVIATKSSNIKW